MAGYDWSNGKSNNAVAAENDGLMTAGALATLLARSYRKLRGLTAADVARVLCSREWHHTSGWFNQTHYYALDSAMERGRRGALYRAMRERVAMDAAKPRVYEGCSVEWLEWTGTRKRPRCTERSATGVTATRAGSKSVILSGGTLRAPMQKQFSTRGFVLRDSSGNLISA